MIKKLSFALFIVLLSGNIPLMAQNLANSNTESQAAPSLNAPGAGNGQGISVDKYTGKLQAGFSIYSYQNSSTGLHHSISISYKGGGIGVDDIASNIGLGWTLNTGGSIVRNINDLPDEGVFDSAGILRLSGFSSPGSLAIATVPNGVQLSDYSASIIDGSYDDYVYSAGSQSGSFHVGKDGSILQIPLTNVKIEQFLNGYSPSSAPLDSCYNISYRVTLLDGTKYIYGNFDCSKVNFNDTFSVHRNIYASSTWYLSKIIAPFNKDSICFDYAPVLESYWTGMLYDAYLVNNTYDGNPIFIDTIMTRARDMRLTDIRYPDGTIVNFNYDAFTRLDVPTDNALNNITITNGTTSYGYKFNYSYSHNLNAGGLDPLNPYSYQDYSSTRPTDTNQMDYRLILNNYNVFSDTDSLPGSTFLYYPPIPVSRGSEVNVDDWGYYSSTADSRVPINNENYLERDADIGSENGSLQEIILPTGGNIQIQYQNNDYENDQVNTSVSHVLGAAYDTSTTTVQGYEGHLCGEPGTFLPAGLEVSAPPETGVPQMAVTFTISLHDGWPISSPHLSVSDIALEIDVNYPVGDGAHAYANFTTLDHGPQTVTEYLPASETIFRFLFSYTGSGSSYSGGVSYSPLFDITAVAHEVNSSETITYDTVNTIAGGIRVSAMISSDSTGQNNQIVKQYQYVGDDGRSSGILSNSPVYSFSYTENYDPAPTNPLIPLLPDEVNYNYASGSVLYYPTTGYVYPYTVYTSQADNSVQSTHGSPVGYNKVEEYLGTPANYKQKTINYFTNQFFDTTGVGALFVNPGFPFAPAPNLDFASGLPLSTYNYNSAGVLLSDVQNWYTISLLPRSDSDYMSIKTGITYYPTNDNVTNFKYQNYYPVTGKVFPVYSSQTSYFEGNDSIVSYVATTYDTTNMVVRSTQTTDSWGLIETMNYYYPYDFSIPGAITQLQDSGMVYFPIRTEAWKRFGDYNYLCGSSVSAFQQLADGSVKPQASFALTVSDPVIGGTWGAFDNTQLLQNPSSFTLLGTADKYDVKGNLLQATSKGMSSSTIWGYNKQFPVASITNAAYSDVAYTSFEGGDNDFGNWTAGGSVLLQAGGITGNSCALLGGRRSSGATTGTLTANGLTMTTAYVISLWSNSGSVPTVTTDVGTIGLAPSDTHNGWTLYKNVISGTTYVTLTGAGMVPAKIDELRLYPSGAAMTTTTYNPLFGVTSKCDASNRTMYNDYDAFGRLRDQRDMDRNIIKKYDYKNLDPQY